jgi:DNA-binding NtrC family response regulator
MDVLKDITAIDSTITVIMITALEHVTLAAEAIEHGAASYVLKPFDLRRLDAVVAETLASRPRRDRAR